MRPNPPRNEEGRAAITDTTFDELLPRITAKALRGDPVDRDELLEVLASGDDDLLDVIAAAGRVRREFFGRRVKLNYLVNMKSGMCPEDCGCSQRLVSTAEILKYSWIDADEATQHAQCAIDAGAKRVCLVAAGRGPGDRDIERVAETVAAIKDGAPAVELTRCAPPATTLPGLGCKPPLVRHQAVTVACALFKTASSIVFVGRDNCRTACSPQ